MKVYNNRENGKMQYIKIFFAICTPFCLLLAGCSISTSVGTSSKSSDSSSSICKSSSESGDTALTENKRIYQEDVAAFTNEAVHTGLSQDEFIQGLTRIAVSHGITCWDMLGCTYEAIGMGLKSADVAPKEIHEEPFLKKLVMNRPGAIHFIMRGYDKGGDV